MKKMQNFAAYELSDLEQFAEPVQDCLLTLLMGRHGFLKITVVAVVVGFNFKICL